jgi:hypothetical protein
MITMNNYKFGTRTKIMTRVINLEKELRVIPLHRETRESMEEWSDEYLARYHWQLQELKARTSGDKWTSMTRIKCTECNHTFDDDFDCEIHYEYRHGDKS